MARPWFRLCRPLADLLNAHLFLCHTVLCYARLCCTMLCYAVQCYATDHTASFNHCSFTTGCWVILCHPVQRNVVTQCHQLFHDLLSYSPPMLGQRWCRHQFFLLFSISSALGCCQPYTGEPMIVSGVSGGLAGVQKLVSRHQRAKQPIAHLGARF